MEGVAEVGAVGIFLEKNKGIKLNERVMKIAILRNMRMKEW